MDQKTCVVCMYVGPHTSERKLEDLLTRIYKDAQHRIIKVGDINARRKAWDKVTNLRGIPMNKASSRMNYLNHHQQTLPTTPKEEQGREKQIC